MSRKTGLDKSQARAIYRAYQKGTSTREIAAQFGISAGTVSRVANSPHLYGLPYDPLCRPRMTMTAR